MSAYLEDILAQPNALRRTLAALDETTLPGEIRTSLVEGRWRRILLTGMGSSYFALIPLYQRLLAAGYPAWLLDTSELLYAPTDLTRDALLVAASQSGASGEIVHLLEKLARGTDLIGLTNTRHSPLDQGATFSLVTQAGDEASVSCKTYVAALAAQCWLGDQLCGGAGQYPGLAKAPDLVAAYLARLPEHVNALTHRLEGIQQVYLAGRGVSLPSAGTGGLIMKEAAHVAAEGMSSAAFRHGPIEMVGPETFVLVFAGAGETTPLNRRLYDDITRLNSPAAWVETNGGTGVFDLPPCPPQALPLLEILPVQMMTLALAELRHRTAGDFTRTAKVTATE